jgi:hypothetical protein
MNFIKKYSILLIPAGIALVAVVFVAFTMLTSRSLAQDISGNSVAAHQQISTLLGNPVPVGAAAAEKVLQDGLEQDVVKVESLVRQGSMRELLNYEVFPKPKDDSQQLFDAYKESYRAAIEGLVHSMRALNAPSASEIEKEVGASAASLTKSAQPYAPALGSDYSYGREENSVDYSMPAITTSRDKTQQAQKAMLEAVCSRRAEEISVYADPSLFEWYDYWGSFKFNGTDSAVNDCWYSQVAYWIYEDVVATIRQINEGSQSAYTSPVKRLVGVSFTKAVDYKDTLRSTAAAYRDEYAYGLGGPGGGALSTGDMPDYIFDKAGGLLSVEPWTGRVCNDDIDVIHFNMGVVASSSSVMRLMRELCSVKQHTYHQGYAKNGPVRNGQHNQITILRSEVLPVDLTSKQHEYFRYGNDAVVRVDFVCEYILPRAGYDTIKPESIKVALRQSQAAQPAPGMMPGGPGPGAGSGAGPGAASPKPGRSSGRGGFDEF